MLSDINRFDDVVTGVFKVCSAFLDGFSQYVHNFYKDLAPDEEIFNNTQTVASIAMITKAANDLLKGLFDFFKLGGKWEIPVEQLEAAANNF